MGFEKLTDNGVHMEDLKLALKGHVREDYQFKPGDHMPAGDPFYNQSPTLNDGVHVLVSVIPAGSVSLLSDEVVKKMREVRLAASGMGIPQVTILTKVDEACPEVKKDINNVYKSKYLRKQENLDFMNTYKPHNYEATHLRILLHGPVGAGKSSFINSVDSVLQGRVTSQAQTDATFGSSFTSQYNTFIFRKDKKGIYSFVFNDIMGLELKDNTGVHVEDLKLALMGHVREGYQFNPIYQMQKGDPFYNPYPTLNDRVHVLVSVIPAGSVPLLTEEAVKKMREVRLAASEMRIPQMAIITKADEACPQAKQDINNVYKSKYLKEQIDKFSEMLGLPLNCIFAVKNYETEISTDEGTDALILCALRQMINYGEDFLNNRLTAQECFPLL
ncbi:interferon-induced protein 44-like [Pagrus major]|uniref:interferon-induced protein 44-like n=1 Tax=Pagrus major TaxID=143350 RepID=UPI003CC8A59A